MSLGVRWEVVLSSWEIQVTKLRAEVAPSAGVAVKKHWYRIDDIWRPCVACSVRVLGGCDQRTRVSGSWEKAGGDREIPGLQGPNPPVSGPTHVAGDGRGWHAVGSPSECGWG